MEIRMWLICFKGDTMKANISILLLCALTFLPGCVTSPTREQVKDAYYGPYPENGEELIKNYMKNVLDDPQSAVYEFRETFKGYGNSWSEYPYGKVEFGWVFVVYIKNRFGGHVGFKPHKFVIRDNEIVATDSIYRTDS